jgi:hypothetical protein
MAMSKPLRATHHCRHYSYVRGLSGGPSCALGVDLSGPGASAKCWPEPKASCDKRENFTDAERAAWKAYTVSRLTMLGEAVAAIPAPIPCGTTGECPCPHCDGELRWSRASNGHVWLSCTTTDCIGPVHFNVDRKASWPVNAGDAA